MVIESDARFAKQFIGTLRPSSKTAPIPAHDVYSAFIAWCERNDVPKEIRPSEVVFGRQTSALGVEKHRTSSGVLYVGVVMT